MYSDRIHNFAKSSCISRSFGEQVDENNRHTLPPAEIGVCTLPAPSTRPRTVKNGIVEVPLFVTKTSIYRTPE